MDSERPLVLASTSPFRRRLLEQAGILFEAVAPPYEEEHDLGLEPMELVVELARRKARSLQDRFPDRLVLAADQAPVCEGAILLKPGSRAGAHKQLQRLQGKAHRLLTGVALLDTASGRCETAASEHRMVMRPLDAAAIDRYLDRDEPYGCAGSYRVEARGVLLFEAMEGDDHTGIIGLPLSRVVTLLQRFGVAIP